MSWQKSYNSDVNSVVAYCANHSVRLEPIQEKLLNHTLDKVPRSVMLGAPEVINICQNLIRAVRAKNILDIGCFTGFSALGWALAVPANGRVITMDVNEETTKLAQEFWKEAGVDSKITLKLQPATKTLDELVADGELGKFDFAFIDADKGNYDYYYESCLKLLRPGGIIAIDNTLWNGAVLDEKTADPTTSLIQKLNKKIHEDQRVTCSVLPMADGLTLVFLPTSSP